MMRARWLAWAFFAWALFACAPPQPAQASIPQSLPCRYTAGQRNQYSCVSIAAGYQPTTPTYSVGWYANSLGAGTAWGTTMTQGLVTTPAGVAYPFAFYDEGGHELTGIVNGVPTYFSNDLHGFGRNGTNAIAYDGTYIYIGMTQKDSGSGTNAGGLPNYPTSPAVWNSIRRYNWTLGAAIPTIGGAAGYGSQRDQLVVSTATNSIVNKPITGIAVTDGKIIVSDPYDNQVNIYDASTFVLLRQIAVTNPGPIVSDGSTHFWVVTGSATNTANFLWNFSAGYQLLAYDTSGNSVPAGSITLPSTSIIGGMCLDPSADLVIADSGPDQNYKVFANPLTAPTQIGTIGTTSGVFAGPLPGTTGAMRFEGPNGCGFDVSGNFYAAGKPFLDGSWVEEYGGTALNSPRVWNVSAQTYIDGGGYDPTTGYAYSSHGKFTFNTSSSTSLFGSQVAETYNVFGANAADDPRIHDHTSGVTIRVVNGTPLMYILNQIGNAFEAYKQVANTAYWQPSVLFNLGGFRSWPSPIPTWAANFNYVWTDTSGTGNFSAGTYATPAPLHSGITTSKSWYVAKDGTVIHAQLALTNNDVGGWLNVYPLNGFDGQGNPVYNNATASLVSLPTGTPIRMLYFVAYDSDNDTLFADGYPTNGSVVTSGQYSNGCVNNQGMNLVAIKNFRSSPPGQIAWARPLPYICTNTLKLGPNYLTESGNYVFAATQAHPVSVYAYNKTTGKQYGPYVSDSSFGGVLDMSYPMNVFQMSAHEYKIFLEDDGFMKITVLDAKNLP